MCALIDSDTTHAVGNIKTQRYPTSLSAAPHDPIVTPAYLLVADDILAVHVREYLLARGDSTARVAA